MSEVKFFRRTFLLTLPDEQMEKKAFTKMIKKYKLKLLDSDLIDGICDMFKSKSNKLNAPLLKETYIKMYPDTPPPPPKKAKKKRRKGKRKGKKGN